MADPVEIVIPSNPADREKIRKVLVDVSNEMTLVDAHRYSIKENLKAMAEEFGLPIKFVNKMAKTYYKDTFDKDTHETDEYVKLYEAILVV